MSPGEVNEVAVGLYESLATRSLEAKVAMHPDLVAAYGSVDDADQAEVLGRHVRDVVQRALAGERDPARRLAIVNRIVESIEDAQQEVSAARQLLSLSVPEGPGRLPIDGRRPVTPLSDAALLTNAHGEPGVGAELRNELPSADAVDAIIAFVRWYGLRLLEPELKLVEGRGVPLRIITTTYMGATERAALDRLVRDFSAQVKVQYDAQRTRLHAKSWIFRRDSGFDTAYVGSSNLSRAALLDGVEWNVRLSNVATPNIMQKARATFDSYWADSTFESYDPDRDRDRLDDALAEASGRRTHDRVTISLSGLEVQPYPFQAEMLEEIAVARQVHDRHRNLVVAATGTGKTVIAALDYRGLCRDLGRRPRLLFVAHRREILTQSLRTYREVLQDPNFGELYVGGARPERWEHVFASVQSLTAYDVANLPPDAFEIVVIDEFHHAEAPTYRAILDHLNPLELLGLTATPERADGVDLRDYFDGHVAAELRLWDALAADLLTPFHYFGIADGTDLSQIEWSRGGYDTADLERVYTGNHARAALVLKALDDKIGDLRHMKGLCFCVSVAHAQFMADQFNRAGISAATVVGTTGDDDRRDRVRALAEGRLQALMTVDVFNEGIDVPEIDAVLFLRPTESATVFLQQLGRGLRRMEGKPVLTALDFVGHHRKEFRFDRRLVAMTGSTRAGLIEGVETDFPFLPAGTQIVLDRASKDAVLENIRANVATRWDNIRAELRAHPTSSLGQHDSGVELSDVVKEGRSWARLRREVGLDVPAGGPREAALLKRVRALTHVDDPDRVTAYLTWLGDEAPAYGDADADLQAYGRMLTFSLWPDGGGFSTYDEALAALRSEPATRQDLRAVIELGLAGAQRVSSALAGSALRVHGRYTREEILAGLGHADLDGLKPKSFQSGVFFAKAANTDAFLVTLHKSDAQYSPTTMYNDYAINRELFHWESQNSTSLASPVGQRYVHHAERGSSVVLFVRERKVSEFGAGAPYLCLGPATYVSHRGERPMAITWRLETPMPTADFEAAKVVA